MNKLSLKQTRMLVMKERKRAKEEAEKKKLLQELKDLRFKRSKLGKFSSFVDQTRKNYEYNTRMMNKKSKKKLDFYGDY